MQAWHIRALAAIARGNLFFAVPLSARTEE
jgi:hypothetical protein